MTWSTVHYICSFRRTARSYAPGDHGHNFIGQFLLALTLVNLGLYEAFCVREKLGSCLYMHTWLVVISEQDNPFQKKSSEQDSITVCIFFLLFPKILS